MSTERQDIMADLLHNAIPINPASGQYVTKPELDAAMSHLEMRIDVRLENSILKTRNWVLGGMIASAILFGGGFLTTIIKIDRMSEKMPEIARQLEARRVWSEEKNEHDYQQDRVLRDLDEKYTPAPIRMPR